MLKILERLNVELDELGRLLQEEQRAALALDAEKLESLLARREQVQQRVQALEQMRQARLQEAGIPAESSIEEVLAGIPKEDAGQLRGQASLLKERVKDVQHASRKLKDSVVCSLTWVEGLLSAKRRYAGMSDKRYTRVGTINVSEAIQPTVSKRA
jgi:flagellar biosynthesis/type III secretory pathway chaperone